MRASDAKRSLLSSSACSVFLRSVMSRKYHALPWWCPELSFRGAVKTSTARPSFTSTSSRASASGLVRIDVRTLSRRSGSRAFSTAQRPTAAELPDRTSSGRPRMSTSRRLNERTLWPSRDVMRMPSMVASLSDSKRAVRKRTSLSASRRLRNWAIWLPIVDEAWRRSASGSLTSSLNNSMTPKTSLSLAMGKAKAPCRPSWVAASMRGKLASCWASEIHTGRFIAHTRPGSPTPGVMVMVRVAFSKFAASNDSADQNSRQLSDSPSTSMHQRAATFQARFEPMAYRMAGPASLNVLDSARTRATAC